MVSTVPGKLPDPPLGGIGSKDHDELVKWVYGTFRQSETNLQNIFREMVYFQSLYLGQVKEKRKDHEKWRLYPTANGLFRVYDKSVSPPSENYGDGAMPYSVMFDPNMYVHYSADFHRRGYARASHGCVNVGDRDDAQWIFRNTPIDALVYVY